MPSTRPPYAPEFRRQIIDLVRAGRDPDNLAREFEPTAQSIRNWVVQADRSQGRQEDKRDGVSSAEREELIKLRREVRQLRLERDILSNRKIIIDYNKAMYRWRHLIENYFAKLKEFCSIATRYDKTDESFSANINLAAALIAAR